MKKSSQGQTGKTPFCPFFFISFPPPSLIAHKYFINNNLKSMRSTRIGSFKDFLRKQRKKKINEQKLSLEIAWWDECIVEVMQDLKDECNGFLDYETLVKYVKRKNQILGKKEESAYDEALLLAHIKDLIFQHHGDSLYTNGSCSWGDNSPEVQAKGLAVGELAKVILDKVLETVQTSDDPIPGTTSATLSDQQPKTLIPAIPVSSCDDCGDDEYCEDLPFEHKKVRPVKKFNDYIKKINETVGIIDCTCKDECIQYCMDKVKEDVGSYDPDGILMKAAQTADPRVKARLVLQYVKFMVLDYLIQEKVVLGLVDVDGNKGKDIPDEALEQGLDILSHQIADEVLEKIANENGVYYEDAESN